MNSKQQKTLVSFWQDEHGLKVDGILGPRTSASIDSNGVLVRPFLGKPICETPYRPLFVQSDIPSSTFETDGCWPVRYADAKFVVSDGFQRQGAGAKRNGRGHYGVDLAIRREVSGDFDLPTHTRHYYNPNDELAVACFAGEVVRVVNDDNGTAVYISHGRYMSVYRHLNTYSVCTLKGDLLTQGMDFGEISHAPKNPRGFNHLHFEIWDTDRRGSAGIWNRKAQAIDPEPFLRKWTR